MPSSKGKPTDPKLREKVKEDIKQKPNSDGGGKGQWSAWKVSRARKPIRVATDKQQAAQLSKEYEAKGGGYENESGSKNEPKKGTPEPKSDSKKDKEVKGSSKKKEDKKDEKKEGSTEKSDKENQPKEEKKKANEKKPRVSQGFMIPIVLAFDMWQAPKKETKDKPAPREGTRKSSRQAEKRKADDAEDEKPKKSAKAKK